jgi:hypothetical protein
MTGADGSLMVVADMVFSFQYTPSLTCWNEV